MHEYTIRAGDRLPAFECQLINHLGVPAENLGSATSIVMKYRPANGGAWVTQPAQLVDASAARVKYEWASGETDVAANFYLDPPYWQTEGYGVEFGFEQYERMAALARSCQGSMLISLNDHPAIRECFADLYMESIGITYTVGGGAGSAARELLIWNQNCETGRRERGTLPLFTGP